MKTLLSSLLIMFLSRLSLFLFGVTVSTLKGRSGWKVRANRESWVRKERVWMGFILDYKRQMVQSGYGAISLVPSDVW